MVQGFKSTPHRNSDTVATPICPSVKIDFISPVDSGEAIFHPVFADVETSLLTVSKKSYKNDPAEIGQFCFVETSLIICLFSVLSAIPIIFPFGIEFSFPNLSTRF